MDAKHITVINPSMTSMESMTMPEEGLLKINGREYRYKSFTLQYKKDAQGNNTKEIESYTFELEAAMSQEDRDKVDGRGVSIGTSVDSMGIPYYMSQMNQFLRAFATAFNDVL